MSKQLASVPGAAEAAQKHPEVMPAKSGPAKSAKGASAAGRAGKTTQRAFWAGVRDAAPLFLSGAPFGLLFGLLAYKVGLGLLGGQAFSSLIFAGSAQFAAADLFGKGAGFLVIIGVTALLNARHLLYALDLATRCAHWPTWGRLVIGYFLTDESYAVTARRLDARPGEPLPLAYFAGASLAMFVAWNLATAVGLLLGASGPDISQYGFSVAIYSAYIAIFVPLLVSAPRWAAAATSLLLSVLLRDWPNQLGLVAAILAGIAVGFVCQALGRSRLLQTRARERRR